jgi:hypothetical protein
MTSLCPPARSRVKLRGVRTLILLLLTVSSVGLGADWQPLFDGKTLAGWTPTKFGGGGEIEVKDGTLILNQGILTGVNYTNPVPTVDYEVAFEARRTMGQDFFCGLTFPVRDSHATLVVGGWGGAVVGISSLNNQDASQNVTPPSIATSRPASGIASAWPSPPPT